MILWNISELAVALKPPNVEVHAQRTLQYGSFDLAS